MAGLLCAPVKGKTNVFSEETQKIDLVASKNAGIGMLGGRAVKVF